MTALQLNKELLNSVAPSRPEMGGQAARHDSPMEDESSMTPSAMRGKLADVEKLMRQNSRHDSVLSKTNEVDNDASPTRKHLNLGSSILKTPSSKASSKASPTPSHNPKPNPDGSAVKTAISPGKIAGSICLTKYDSQWWPVVLCDEKSAPKKFMDTRHDPSHLPAILLGKRIYIWTIGKGLKVLYPGCDYLKTAKRFETDDVLPTDSEQDQTEKLRQRAFRTDARLGKDHVFFMNVIEQEREARQIRKQWEQKGPKRRLWDAEQEHHRSDKQRRYDFSEFKRQRKKLGYATYNRPKVRELMSESDDENDELFVPSAPRKQSYRQESESEDSDEAVEREEEKEDPFEVQQRIMENYQQSFREKKGTCTIFVKGAASQASFKVPNSSLGRCMMLAGLMKRSDGPDATTEDTYIKLYESGEEAAKITAGDFKIVATFLEKGCFTPCVVKGPHGRAVIDGVKTTQDADGFAQQLVKDYHTASLLRFDAMQQHCVGKLARLPPLSPMVILIVMTCFERTQKHQCGAEAEMEMWLVNIISREYWRLTSVEGSGFGRLMQRNAGLRNRVLRRVAEMGREAVPEGSDEGLESV